MLATTGFAALNARVRHEKARRKASKEASKSLLAVYDSDTRSTPLALEANPLGTHYDKNSDMQVLFLKSVLRLR